MKDSSDTLITFRYLTWRRVKPLIPEYYIKKSSTDTRARWETMLMRERALLSAADLVRNQKVSARGGNINFRKYDNVWSEIRWLTFHLMQPRRCLAIFRGKFDADEQRESCDTSDDWSNRLNLTIKQPIYRQLFWKIIAYFHP